MGFQVTRNHLFQTLPTLFKQWTMSVEIMPMGIVDGNSSILHVGHGEDHVHYGGRTPAIFFWSDSTKLRIHSAINGIKHYLIVSDPIPINQWTRVDMSQLRQSEGVYQFTLRIAGIIFHQINNTDAREFSPVKVFAGDAYLPANAKLANLTIDTFPDNNNIVPTLTSTLLLPSFTTTSSRTTASTTAPITTSAIITPLGRSITPNTHISTTTTTGASTIVTTGQALNNLYW